MSQVAIREALENAVAAISPSLATAIENVPFTPPDLSTAYQEVFVLFAEPDNSEFGARYSERGILQVTLRYPPQVGTGGAAARVALLRSMFPRGASFTFSGGRVTITRTPESQPGSVQEGRWVVVVKIRFHTGQLS